VLNCSLLKVNDPRCSCERRYRRLRKLWRSSPLQLTSPARSLVYTFDIHGDETGIAALLSLLGEHAIDFTKSALERKLTRGYLREPDGCLAGGASESTSGEVLV